MRLKILMAAAAIALSGAACDSSKPAKKTEETKAEAETPKEGEKKEEAKVEEASKEATPEPPFLAKGPVAKVNGVDITAEKFNGEIKRLARVVSRLPPAAVDRFRTNTLDRLIDQSLVEAELKTSGLEFTEDEMKEEMKRFNEKMGGDEGAAKFYAQSGITPEELKADMGRAIVLKKYLRKNYGVVVEDKDAKEFYDQNLKRFTEEEQVKASHILLKVEKDAAKDVEAEKKKKAKELLKLATAKDADFAALAKEHSEGPTGPRGGDLGYFPRKRMVPAFAEAAFKTKPGKVTGPVRTEFGFHVIKVTDHKPEKVTSFDEAKPDIVENLERQKMREGMDKLIKKLKAASKVEKFEKNIEANPKFKPAAAPGGFGMPPGMGGGHPPVPGGLKQGGKPPAPKPAPKTPAPK